ncbi:hypothetical protein C0J52_06758 [Blattella germanica]|nr:hypothetical protein C0J52_06758 [Blattella germanica]
MDVPTVVTTVILPLVVLYLLHSLRPLLRFLHLAMKIPTGWDSWPIVGHVSKLFVPRNRLIFLATNLHRNSKKPYVFWLGPVPMLLVTQPKHIEVILSNVKYIDKMFNYAFLYPWLGTGLITSTGSKWHSHRRIIMPAFHYNILENSVEVFVEKTRILVKKLEKEVGSAEFDISHYATLCALDIILGQSLRRIGGDIPRQRPTCHNSGSDGDEVLGKGHQGNPEAVPERAHHRERTQGRPHGYTIPSGMNLGIVPYLTHRDEENFANPNEFDPDRFLPERVVNKHPYAYIPFSAGPRNCIGQKFAMLEMKMVLSSILRSYKVKAVGDFPVALPEIVLRPENGVHVQIAKRDSTA